MKSVALIAKMSLLENSRKQVFHVMCLLMLAIISSSTLLSIFTEGVKIKILQDLCMTTISFGGAVLSVALGCTAIPNDLESRNIHPLLARPVTRVQYVLGKYLGTLITVLSGVMVMAFIFAFLIFSYTQKLDPALFTAMLFTFLEVAVIAAFTTAISTVASPAITAAVSFLVYLSGTIKIGYFGSLLQRTANPFIRNIFRVIYHLLPNLECFNMKDLLIHSDTIPVHYMVTVLLYGFCYIAFVLLLGIVCFKGKEV